MAIDKATLEARLTEAQTALHALMVGQSATVVGYDGHRTEFAPVDEVKLRRYIQQLKRDLGQVGPGGMSRRVRF
ncbi:gpW family head-tail joining protein [Marinovum sp. SP66]|uniref:gpW family head-tail joining protein n=1 Tax=Marinovum TaxID=367771 RepID=UPI00237B8681|nr:gpW family head-tail joining protein [Marinovum sp. SP66]MDD9738437.1 gpW family head-tail joining protein [Marinovum sp. SP66]